MTSYLLEIILIGCYLHLNNFRLSFAELKVSDLEDMHDTTSMSVETPQQTKAQQAGSLLSVPHSAEETADKGKPGAGGRDVTSAWSRSPSALF